MHEVRYQDSEPRSQLDAAPITAEDELGALGELTTGRPEPSSHRMPNRHRMSRLLGRLERVPEHEAPRAGAGWLGRASVLLVGVFLIGTAFIASYVGALHQPQPRDVPIAVLSGDTGAQALLNGTGGESGPFALTVYPDY